MLNKDPLTAGLDDPIRSKLTAMGAYLTTALVSGYITLLGRYAFDTGKGFNVETGKMKITFLR